MTVFTEGRHAAEFIMSEAAGMRSRETAEIAASQSIVPGQVLGKIAGGGGDVTVGAAVAGAGNTGTGAVGTVTADAGAMPGVYSIVIIEPGSGAGKFQVFRPNGVLDGVGTVAVAYNGMINFTIADGDPDFVSGDMWTVPVSYADGDDVGQYVAYDQDGDDGSEVAAAIAIYPATTGADETAKIAVIARDAEVNGKLLAWPSDIEAGEKAAAIAQLAAAGIIVR